MPDEIIPGIVAAAIAAAGQRGNNDAAWKGKINSAIPHIAAMLNPPEGDQKGSRQWQIAAEVLGADVFTSTYVGYEVEETSTRCVVTLDSGRPTEKNPSGHETIRTHRTDGAQGRAMKERLDQLSPGDELVVWKAIEVSANDANKKVRILVHFETRPKRTDRQQEVAARPAGPPPDVEQGPARSAPSGGTSLAYMFDELGSKDKVAVVRRLREENITFPEPDPADASRFIAIVDEVTR